MSSVDLTVGASLSQSIPGESFERDSVSLMIAGKNCTPQEAANFDQHIPVFE